MLRVMVSAAIWRMAMFRVSTYHFYLPIIPLKRRFLCRLGLSVGFLYRLGLGLAVVISVSFSVLGLSLGAGLIIDFVSVRDGLIIEFQSVRDGLIIPLVSVINQF